MYSIILRAKDRVRQSVLRDRRREPIVERLSRRLWPWREAWLARCVVLVAALDFLSTYALLGRFYRPYLFERGPLGHWALHMGGFKALLITEIMAVGILWLLAMGARIAYSRFGYHGYARAAYVATLLPYAVAAFLATVNNLALAVARL